MLEMPFCCGVMATFIARNPSCSSEWKLNGNEKDWSGLVHERITFSRWTRPFSLNDSSCDLLNWSRLSPRSVLGPLFSASLPPAASDNRWSAPAKTDKRKRNRLGSSLRFFSAEFPPAGRDPAHVAGVRTTRQWVIRPLIWSLYDVYAHSVQGPTYIFFNFRQYTRHEELPHVILICCAKNLLVRDRTRASALVGVALQLKRMAGWNSSVWKAVANVSAKTWNTWRWWNVMSHQKLTWTTPILNSYFFSFLYF